MIVRGGAVVCCVTFYQVRVAMYRVLLYSLRYLLRCGADLLLCWNASSASDVRDIRLYILGIEHAWWMRLLLATCETYIFIYLVYMPGTYVMTDCRKDGGVTYSLTFVLYCLPEGICCLVTPLDSQRSTWGPERAESRQSPGYVGG